MALGLIEPFCYERYCTKTLTFADWVVNYVQRNQIRGQTGWISWFTSFQGGWAVGKSGQGGVLGRAKYHTALQKATISDDVCLISFVNQIIVGFHGMSERSAYPLSFASYIRKSLQVLQCETANSPWTPQQISDLDDGCRIAAISKMYQIFDPHKWTIYDSRVAYALARLVELFWAQNHIEVNADLLRFPIPSRRNPPKGWIRPKGFPAAGSGRQGHLAFVYASWLLRQMAEILRSNPQYGYPPTVQVPDTYYPLNPNWQVYHLEMALWMLGDQPF